MKKPKRKSFFRFAQIEMFGAIALCFVGTDLKQHERQFASFMSKFKGKRRPEYYCIGVHPLYGHKSGRLSKTHWMAFVKLPKVD